LCITANGFGLYDRAGLIAGDLTAIRISNIAKYMNKADLPAWRKTRVSGSEFYLPSTNKNFSVITT
jgi:hypothetical protein